MSRGSHCLARRVGGTALTAVAVLLLLASPAAAQTEADQAGTEMDAGQTEGAEIDLRWDTGYCLACHEGTGAEAILPSGEALKLAIDTVAFESSRHASFGVSCVHCHQAIARFPHPELTAEDRRAFTLELSTSCRMCHFDFYTERLDEVHESAHAAGNPSTPVCSDCHDAHAAPPAGLADTDTVEACKRCHADFENIPDTGIVRVHAVTFEPAPGPGSGSLWSAAPWIILGVIGLVLGTSLVRLLRWRRSLKTDEPEVEATAG